MDLITLEEYKLAKGLTKTDQDTVLATLITNVSSLIQKYIERNFNEGVETKVETFNLDYDAVSLYLEEFPINSVTSVTAIDPIYYDSTIHFPVSNTTYTVDLEDGVIHRTNNIPWPQGFGAVTVTYTFGAIPQDISIPPELKQVTIDLVTYYHKEEWKESRSMRGASMGNEPVYGSSTKFPPHIQRVLDLYL